MNTLVRRTASIFIIILSLCSVISAQDARLTNIIVTNTRDDLLIYLTVEEAFREEMEEAVISGVPTTFSFFINLYETRNLWFNKKMATLRITHTIKYDNLKKNFIIRRSWDDGKPITTKSLQEAKQLMSEIDSLKIINLSKLKKGKQYQIRAKAELSKVTLPYYLHYVLFFISLWDFETDWYTIDFIYWYPFDKYNPAKVSDVHYRTRRVWISHSPFLQFGDNIIHQILHLWHHKPSKKTDFGSKSPPKRRNICFAPTRRVWISHRRNTPAFRGFEI